MPEPKPWYKGPPVARERYPNDPIHYFRSGYQRLRIDGTWYRCGYNGCIHSHASRDYITRNAHMEKFHGFTYTNRELPNIRGRYHLVSRAEGERLKQMLSQHQKGEKAAGRPKAPFTRHCVPKQNARPFPTAPVNLAVIHPAAVPPANAPAAPAANVPAAPPANVPAAPAANAPMAPPGNANNQQRTVINHMCNICKRLFASRAAVKTHALNIHATRLIQEPFQPDRVPKVEVDAVSKQPVKLAKSLRLQEPGFLTVCEELRELFYKALLTIPIAMRHGNDKYDKYIFQVLLLNKSIAEQTMALFSKWNFLIQISISSYEEDDLDIFERTIARDFQVVPSGLAPKLGEPALSISLHLLSERRLRRTTRRIQVLVIYTERSLIDLIELINRYTGILEALKVEFARYASDERFGSVKRMIEQYLGLLSNIPQLLWYDGGSIVNNKTTQRMRESNPQDPEEWEERLIRDLRRSTILFQEQIRRRMVGPARMTESWLIKCLDMDVSMSRERMLGPDEGSERSRRLQCAQRQLASDTLLAILQLLVLREDYEPSIDPYQDKDNFKPSRHLYTTFKTVKARMFRFPGVSDSFRAEAHLQMGIVASRIARNMLDVQNARNRYLHPDQLDPDFEVPLRDGRAMIDYASDDAGSESDENSMEDAQSEQSEEPESASDGQEDSAGSDTNSEASNSTTRGPSPSALGSRPTHDTLWGNRGPDAESNASEQTLPGNRRFSGSDASHFSAYDTAMEGVLQESPSDFAPDDFNGRSAMSSTWDDGDAMEDVQHSEPGSLSEHSVDEDMDDVQQSVTSLLNEPIPSSDGESSADGDGYNSDSLSTATESTIRPPRERPAEVDGTASETSTYVPTPDVKTFDPRFPRDRRHQELRQDKLVTPPFSETAAAMLARIAMQHFFYADQLYIDAATPDITLKQSVTATGLITTTKTSTVTTTVRPGTFDFRDLDLEDEHYTLLPTPTAPHMDELCKAFFHEPEAMDWPMDPVSVEYGHGNHKPFEWRGALVLARAWDARYGQGVAFERMADWQKRPEGWEEEGEEMRREIGEALDEVVEMAKKEGRM